MSLTVSIKFIHIMPVPTEKKKEKKPYSVKGGFRVLILKSHPFSMKRLNTDTKIHLAHVQAFFYKLESVAGEKIFLLYLFDKKIIVIIK